MPVKPPEPLKSALGTLSWMSSTAVLILLLVPAAGTSRQVAIPPMSDESITRKVEEELLFDHAVTYSSVAFPTPHGAVELGIDVATSEGIVVLGGSVSNVLARDRAARIAETVRGVRGVVNGIGVRPPIRLNGQLRLDVEEALRDNPATEVNEVDVGVEDGVVTLRGSVDSYQERELVRRIAAGIHGVRQIQGRIDVQYQADRLDYYEIEQEIEQVLRWDVRVDEGAIDVAVADGVAVLSGTVGSAAEKRLAYADAWVAGIRSVDVSELDVNPDAMDPELALDQPPQPTSGQMREAAKHALELDPRVAPFGIGVHVEGATATLTGTVNTLAARRAAEQDTRNIRGILAVENHLTVDPVDARLRRDIADAVRLTVARDPDIERFGISVFATDAGEPGRVHLAGTVATSFERNRAGFLASTVPGVAVVENHIRVEPDLPPVAYNPYLADDDVTGHEPTSPHEVFGIERRRPNRSDARIQSQIEYELWWSPFIDSNQTVVTVQNGVATLSGDLSSWTQLSAAIANAYEGGASIVDSDLVVVDPE